MTVILLGRTTIFMVLYMKFKNYISKSRDGFKHVGALDPGSCGGPFLVCRGKENKLGLNWTKPNRIWPKLIRSLALMSFFTGLD